MLYIWNNQIFKNKMENNNEITLNQNNDTELDVEKNVKYWIEMSDNDFATMLDMFNIKRYNWALFIGHLVVEKLIKAVYVKINQKHPPFLHDLLKLVNRSNIQVTNEQMDILDTITTFNINARYDDYKLAFYNKCTLDYTTTWIKNIKEIRQWIIDTQLK